MQAKDLTPYNQLGSELKTLRVKAGLKQKEVASKLGYTSPQFISNWERGISSPPVKSLKQLAEIYNTNPDSLFKKLRKAIMNNLDAEFQKSVG